MVNNKDGLEVIAEMATEVEAEVKHLREVRDALIAALEHARTLILIRDCGPIVDRAIKLYDTVLAQARAKAPVELTPAKARQAAAVARANLAGINARLADAAPEMAEALAALTSGPMDICSSPTKYLEDCGECAMCRARAALKKAGLHHE